jgi:hypothetical protein
MDIAVRYVIVPRRHLYWVEAVDSAGSRRAIEVFRDERAAVERLRSLQSHQEKMELRWHALRHGSMWLAILGAWSPNYRGGPGPVVALHRFKIGQQIVATAFGVLTGSYEITRLLPLVAGVPHYRAKKLSDGLESAFSELSLRPMPGSAGRNGTQAPKSKVRGR